MISTILHTLFIRKISVLTFPRNHFHFSWFAAPILLRAVSLDTEHSVPLEFGNEDDQPGRFTFGKNKEAHACGEVSMIVGLNSGVLKPYPSSFFLL